MNKKKKKFLENNVGTKGTSLSGVSIDKPNGTNNDNNNNNKPDNNNNKPANKLIGTNIKNAPANNPNGPNSTHQTQKLSRLIQIPEIEKEHNLTHVETKKKQLEEFVKLYKKHIGTNVIHSLYTFDITIEIIQTKIKSQMGILERIKTEKLTYENSSSVHDDDKNYQNSVLSENNFKSISAES
jgi:hypothetical protein